MFFFLFFHPNLFPVPPHQILVYDASGRDVSGTVGPLYEGDSLVLSCEVRGGKNTFFPPSTATPKYGFVFSNWTDVIHRKR